MKFKLTVKFPGQNGNPDGMSAEWHDLASMKEQLQAVANVLDALVPGETVTIERIS